MSARYMRTDDAGERPLASAAALGVLRVLWYAIRLPVLVVLSLLEPIVSAVLAGLALLGVLTTLFFGLVGPPDFPFLTMLAISVGFGLALIPYHLLIRVLSME